MVKPASVLEIPEKRQSFEAVLAEYGTQMGSLIPVLQKSQDIFGYLPEEVMASIAKATHKKEAEVFGVASFYAQFRFEPVGEHIIKVCHGTACHVAGAGKITDALCNELNMAPGETSKDMQFTLLNVACLGCCSLAPVIMIGDKTYGRLTTDSVVKIIRKEFVKGA